jgi:type III restriction enzyme
MLQRVIPELMGLKRIVVLNDEAHHCYRAKPSEEKLTGDDKSTAEEQNETARVWISGLEAIKTKLDVLTVYDLSATPFFLRGSGYAEGTLFPWTMSDFSLMDAIECGIVKLPRVPVSDNLPHTDFPLYRNLWHHIGSQMPKKRRGEERADPALLPPQLQTALQVLYGHYVKTFEAWQAAGISTPPCFIIVCNNTASSRLVYDYISGYEWPNATGGTDLKAGALELFRNYDSHGSALDTPHTLLIDSAQLESGDTLDPAFRAAAAGAIETFRNERIRRMGGNLAEADVTDAELLREVMNTVGKPGRLGATIRCVVSVSMLTEGWDANTVTHILGVRAFSTQLLCEQVIGRALRRQSYDLNPSNGLFDAEYADVFGIPFDFSSEPTQPVIKPPRETVHVHALDTRQHCEITFPVVQGYRTELPEDRLVPTFTPDSRLVLSADLVGPTQTVDAGIIGQQADMDLQHLRTVSFSTVVSHLTAYLVHTRYLDSDGQPRAMLYGQVRPIVRTWLEQYVSYLDGTHYGLFMYKMLAAQACEKIALAITQTYVNERPIRALLAPFNPTGSTATVSFTSTKPIKHLTPDAPAKSHLNYHICDSGWEETLCKVLDEHPQVIRYVKNHGMGFVVPYVLAGVPHQYIPDFIAHIDDGHGAADPLQLVIEVKGYRGADAVVKKQTMETLWVPGVNALQRYGRWAFAELRDPQTFALDIADVLRGSVDVVLHRFRTHHK